MTMMMSVASRCPMCGDSRVIPVPAEGYTRWQGGALIQEAFPDLSTNDREALITGYCQSCWDKMFPEEEY